ncbi:hypothetical protein [Streptomyces sp. NPDC006971]|uniref:hypothetical protein n=1 Tax=Streptomyces sp. NPDC006971 TaxID=3154784 RepID=UPI0033E2A2BB
MTGCSSGPGAVKPEAQAKKTVAKKAPGYAPERVLRLVGAGSTAFTGSQPNQPVAQHLASGQKPLQIAVLSGGGAGGGQPELLSYFLEVGRKYRASMT